MKKHTRSTRESKTPQLIFIAIVIIALFITVFSVPQKHVAGEFAGTQGVDMNPSNVFDCPDIPERVCKLGDTDYECLVDGIKHSVVVDQFSTTLGCLTAKNRCDQKVDEAKNFVDGFIQKFNTACVKPPFPQDVTCNTGTSTVSKTYCECDPSVDCVYVRTLDDGVTEMWLCIADGGEAEGTAVCTGTGR